MANSSAVQNLFDLQGKTALVTGATGALGDAAARALAKAGAHVVICGGNRAKLDLLAKDLKQDGSEVTIYEGRPSDERNAVAMIRSTEVAGGLDILIAASGTSVVKPIEELQPEQWDAVMDANVRQIWLLCRAASRVFRKQAEQTPERGGKIILISSVRANFATAAGTSAYGPSKSAVNMLTKSLAVELGPTNVCVNAIAPTVFRSNLTAWLFEDDAAEQRAQVLSRIPIGRLGEPADFAGVFTFLASNASDLITGEIINVDGGFSCN